MKECLGNSNSYAACEGRVRAFFCVILKRYGTGRQILQSASIDEKYNNEKFVNVADDVSAFFS